MEDGKVEVRIAAEVNFLRAFHDEYNNIPGQEERKVQRCEKDSKLLSCEDLFHCLGFQVVSAKYIQTPRYQHELVKWFCWYIFFEIGISRSFTIGW